MVTLLNFFGRSPFNRLQAHMKEVAGCVHQLQRSFQALEKKDFEGLEKSADQVCTQKHLADLIKNDIRNHLPKSLFLPLNRTHVLEMLALQDDIAEAAESVAVLLTLKPLELVGSLKEEFYVFFNRIIDAFDAAMLIIKEMHDLLESSFGGIEAEKVRGMVEDVAVKVHEIGTLKRKLLKILFQAEKEMSYSTFFLWLKIFETAASLSKNCEKLAYRVRMTLEIK